MVRTGNNLASGFLGPVKGWGSLVPSAQSALQLPRDLRDWRAGEDRNNTLDLVELTAFTESMGRVEDAFVDFAALLRDGKADLAARFLTRETSAGLLEMLEVAEALAASIEARTRAIHGISDDPAPKSFDQIW